MIKYKNYYIDGTVFKSKNDIDEHLKNLAIERYKKLNKMFSKNPSMELSSLLSDLSIKLHDEHKLSYKEIELLEMYNIV